MAIPKGFEEHLKDPSPGFECYAAGDGSEKLSFVAKVRHQFGKPATKAALKTIDEKLGKKGDQLRSFFERHDGWVMYEDFKSDAAGVRFFKVANWDEETEEVHEWFDLGGGDEEEMPECFLSGCAFAEIPHSGNRFVIAVKGRDAGKIFYYDHDDYNEDPVAKNFNEFIALILKDPAAFMDQFGCYTRYSDGKTKAQWIPKRYLPNCK